MLNGLWALTKPAHNQTHTRAKRPHSTHWVGTIERRHTAGGTCGQGKRDITDEPSMAQEQQQTPSPPVGAVVKMQEEHPAHTDTLRLLSGTELKPLHQTNFSE